MVDIIIIIMQEIPILIGIEMCCTAGNYKVSAKTIKNTAYLTANLCKRLGIKQVK